MVHAGNEVQEVRSPLQGAGLTDAGEPPLRQRSRDSQARRGPEEGSHLMSEQPIIQPILLRAHQVATLLGIHRNTVWNRVRADKLPKPVKWDGVTVWRRSDIEEFVDKLGG